MRLYGSLRDQYRPKTAGGAPHHPFSVSVPDTATLQTLLTALGISDGLVQTTAVNGESAVALTQPLAPNDDIRLFPPIAGG